MQKSLFIGLAIIFCYSAVAQAKTVLVTGSNRGIGLEFVTQYAADGWDVIATSRSPGDDEDLKALAASHASVTIEQLDVTNLDHIAALAAKYDGTAIDVLVNNAGMFGDGPGQAWGSLDQGLFEQVMAVNVFGPLKISEAFAPHVAASEDKKIIVISSASGSIGSVRGPPRALFYSISKAAVNMAMHGTAMRLKEQNITVGIFSPGGVDTRMLRQAFGMAKADAEAAEDFDYRGFTPLTTEQSVSQMRATIDGLTVERSGLFLNYEGKDVPW